ncbi:sensor histidine kinase [Jatrophihabitans sp. DSM 45814]
MKSAAGAGTGAGEEIAQVIRAASSKAAEPDTDSADAFYGQEWRVLNRSLAEQTDQQQPASLRRIFFQFGTAMFVVVLLVAIAGGIISRRLAEQQSVHEAAETTNILATAVFQPLLTDPMTTDSTAANSKLGPVVLNGVLSGSLIRIKLWNPAGLIVFSDEKRLVGTTFVLDDEAQSSLTRSRTEASVSDLRRPENVFERSQGKLLEVYRPVWTPSGRPMLLEAYFRYDSVNAQTLDLWRGFSGIMVSSLVAVAVLLFPLLWTLVRRVRREEARREALTRRSLDAATEERKRIAADLHDGVVQQLVASSFSVAAAGERASAIGDHELAANLATSATTVRSSIAGLRSLLVDIYPPSLEAGGLEAGLRDLVGTMTGRGPRIQLSVDQTVVARLRPEAQESLFRVAQESLRNALRHAHASTILISVGTAAFDHQPGDLLPSDVKEYGDGGRSRTYVRLEIQDDGAGFDTTTPNLARRDRSVSGNRRGEDGHLGLELMSDIAARSGSMLAIRSAPGQGTTVRMDLPYL